MTEGEYQFVLGCYLAFIVGVGLATFFVIAKEAIKDYFEERRKR